MNFAYFCGHITSEPTEGETSTGKPKINFHLGSRKAFYKTFVPVQITGESRVKRFSDLKMVVGDRLHVEGPIGSIVRKGKATLNYIQAVFFLEMGRTGQVNPIDRERVEAYGRKKAAPFDSV